MFRRVRRENSVDYALIVFRCVFPVKINKSLKINCSNDWANVIVHDLARCQEDWQNARLVVVSSGVGRFVSPHFSVLPSNTRSRGFGSFWWQQMVESVKVWWELPCMIEPVYPLQRGETVPQDPTCVTGTNVANPHSFPPSPFAVVLTCVILFNWYWKIKFKMWTWARSLWYFIFET